MMTFTKKCGLSYQTLMEKKVLFDFSLSLSGLKLTPALELLLLTKARCCRWGTLTKLTHTLLSKHSLSLPLTNTNKSSTHLHTLFHSILNTPTKRSLHTLYSTHSHTLLHYHLSHTHTRCTHFYTRAHVPAQSSGEKKWKALVLDDLWSVVKIWALHIF